MEKYNFEYRYINQLDEEMKKALAETYLINDFDIEDVFTETQLSKTERRSDYLYIALQLPEFDQENRQFVAKEVHCFISKKFLLIIDKNNFKNAMQFDEWQKATLDKNFDSFTLFYEMLDFCVNKAYRALRKFSIEINQLELDIFQFRKKFKDLLKEILVIKRNIVNFTNIMYPIQLVIEEIQNKHLKFLDNQEWTESIDDSLDKVKKIINNLKNYKDQIDMLSQSNENLIARNTNEVIKILTVFNLLFLVPTTITSFFGMNIWFGWHVDAVNYWPLIGILSMIAITIIVTIYIIKKKRLL